MSPKEIYAHKRHQCAENDIYAESKESMTENVIYARSVIYAAGRRAGQHRASLAGNPAAGRGPARTPVDSTA
jgi:hypothetical protein